MMIFLIILASLLWIGAFAAFPRRIILGPPLSCCALILLSLARRNGYPLVPLSSGMTLSWISITLVVMIIIILQNPAIRMQSRGTGYMLIGALAGMAVGLLGYTFSPSSNLLYAIMLIATAAGICLGLLIFSNTPDGRAIAPGPRHLLRYLLAKGFPALVTVGQLGIAAVILIAANGIATI